MLLVRHFERALLDLFSRGEVNGTTHTCLGQEHVPVAVERVLGPADFVFSNHRGHGHCLARFDDPSGLLAEILGREGAVCGGYGGSQHVLRDTFLSTGVQGESLPVAVGVALRQARTRSGNLAVAYIGDGTLGEGSVYEALNMASLWSLPLVVIVEHNGIAQSTPTRRNLAGTISGRAAAFGVPHLAIDSIDPLEIADLLEPLVLRARAGRPLVVEIRPPRVGPHSKGDDTRSAAELAAARAADWYPRHRGRLGPVFDEIDRSASARIEKVVAEVRGRPAVRTPPERTGGRDARQG